jgi:hypothetical protein
MKLQRHGGPRGRRQQQGVGLLVILLIIGLLVAIASALAALNRGQGSSADSEKSRLDASTIISQGGALASAAVRYSQDRPLSGMTLDTTANTGLYDTGLALISQNDAPSTAIDTAITGAGVFKFDSTTFKVINTTSGDPTMWTPGLKPVVCKQINKALWGDSIDAALPTSAGARQEGCADLGGTSGNTYWKVVLPG